MQVETPEKGSPVAKILPDKEIRKLLATVVLKADESRINPNGIEIRLGDRVHFQSTDEEKGLGPGMFLKVLPGESVIISSLEAFDFRREAIRKIYPGCDLMAMITPTTTMMREGILQASTKVDSGWEGMLNWGLRNSSVRDFVIGYGEPIFKLTFFLLEEGETPEALYGSRSDDRYQSTRGIAHSTRTIPANIPKKMFVGSTVEALDPVRQLREAGYPFNHISTELVDLHGKFEIVSKDVALLRDTIDDEASKLSDKIDSSEKTVLEWVEHLFDRKFLTIAGAVVGCATVMFGILTFLRTHGITGAALGWVALIAGLGILLVVYLVTTRHHIYHGPEAKKATGQRSTHP
jgi:deoxycytidine triphosphate deaminase